MTVTSPRVTPDSASHTPESPRSHLDANGPRSHPEPLTHPGTIQHIAESPRTPSVIPTAGLTPESMLTTACQTWAVWSPEPVRTRSRLGWKRTELTEPSWPWYWSRHRPESTDHTHAVWSEGGGGGGQG